MAQMVENIVPDLPLAEHDCDSVGLGKSSRQQQRRLVNASAHSLVGVRKPQILSNAGFCLFLREAHSPHAGKRRMMLSVFVLDAVGLRVTKLR